MQRNVNTAILSTVDRYIVGNPDFAGTGQPERIHSQLCVFPNRYVTAQHRISEQPDDLLRIFQGLSHILIVGSFIHLCRKRRAAVLASPIIGHAQMVAMNAARAGVVFVKPVGMVNHRYRAIHCGFCAVYNFAVLFQCLSLVQNGQDSSVLHFQLFVDGAGNQARFTATYKQSVNGTLFQFQGASLEDTHQGHGCALLYAQAAEFLNYPFRCLQRCSLDFHRSMERERTYDFPTAADGEWFLNGKRTDIQRFFVYVQRDCLVQCQISTRTVICQQGHGLSILDVFHGLLEGGLHFLIHLGLVHLIAAVFAEAGFLINVPMAAGLAAVRAGLGFFQTIGVGTFRNNHRCIILRLRWRDRLSVCPIGTAFGQQIYVSLVSGKGNAFKLALDDGNLSRIWPQLQLGSLARFHGQAAVHIQLTKHI